jgi:hypothetical protein
MKFLSVDKTKILKEVVMVDRKSWQEFRDSGMLWWINMILHTFGWAICVDVEDGEIVDSYPARVKFRGFDEDRNTEGYQKVTRYLEDNVEQLSIEAFE